MTALPVVMRTHLVFIGILTASLMPGCAAQTRYQVLSFLFDGVPPPRPAQPATAGARKSAAAAASGRYRDHGPFAARLCDGCHRKDGSNNLLLPLEELCVSCHTINMEGKKTHGPLASGGCRSCHDPHGSPNRYLLVTRAGEFCLQCHADSDIRKRAVHEDLKDGECTACHDAHGSANRYLLK